MASEVNVGMLLAETARDNPRGIAVVEQGPGKNGTHTYRQVTFRELEDDSNRITAELNARGIGPGVRIVLLVRPGIDFVALVFALFKSGAVMVLIDPGMGGRHLIQCLSDVEPDGFVALPRGQIARLIYRKRFPKATRNITVGPWIPGGGTTLARLRRGTADWQRKPTRAEDPAAIIFTTGSTGAPKGVLYRHGNFARQVVEIRDHYGIEAGDVDVACFPLFALFNAGMGVTTVFPSMDFTRPADVTPQHVVAAVNDWQARQAFGSPALWNTVGVYCERAGAKMPSLTRILSAGAPVPPHVLRRIVAAAGEGAEMYTPYGATEALPIASISATEVLGETAQHSEEGAGTCVGSRFPGIEWKVIQIRDDALESMAEVQELPNGEIGELIVSGPVVTTEYVTRREANAFSKIQDGQRFWHRMGDVGYRDEQDRFWYCGRKAHRVEVAGETMFTIPCEAIFNSDERVYRSALVNAGTAEAPEPTVIVELHQMPEEEEERQKIVAELTARSAANPLTRHVHQVMLHPGLPVDIRHNSKIFREQLAVWAAEQG